MAGSNQSGNTLPALWASTTPRNETDALVRFYTADGAIMVTAKGLLKPASKLAPLLKPGDELSLELARGRGSPPVLVGVHRMRPHPTWQTSLHHTALCWFMTECAAVSSGDSEQNTAMFQLVVNLLRSEPAAQLLPSALAVFCLRLLSLHGLMLDLGRCAISGERLQATEPVHLLPTGDGLIGRQAYNEHYARTGGGMPRFDPERLQRWRALAKRPLLEYTDSAMDRTDCVLLLHLVEQQLARPAGEFLGSSSFLRKQWQLPDWASLCSTPFSQ